MAQEAIHVLLVGGGSGDRALYVSVISDHTGNCPDHTKATSKHSFETETVWHLLHTKYIHSGLSMLACRDSLSSVIAIQSTLRRPV